MCSHLCSAAEQQGGGHGVSPSGLPGLGACLCQGFDAGHIPARSRVLQRADAFNVCTGQASKGWHCSYPAITYRMLIYDGEPTPSMSVRGGQGMSRVGTAPILDLCLHSSCFSDEIWLWLGGREGLQPQTQPQAASCKQAPTEEKTQEEARRKQRERLGILQF